MKKFTCDICGQEVASDLDLRELKESFKIADINHMCEKCEKVLNKALLNMEAVMKRAANGWIKELVYRLVLKYSRK